MNEEAKQKLVRQIIKHNENTIFVRVGKTTHCYLAATCRGIPLGFSGVSRRSRKDLPNPRRGEYEALRRAATYMAEAFILICGSPEAAMKEWLS